MQKQNKNKKDEMKFFTEKYQSKDQLVMAYSNNCIGDLTRKIGWLLRGFLYLKPPLSMTLPIRKLT